MGRAGLPRPAPPRCAPASARHERGRGRDRDRAATRCRRRSCTAWWRAVPLASGSGPQAAARGRSGGARAGKGRCCCLPEAPLQPRPRGAPFRSPPASRGRPGPAASVQPCGAQTARSSAALRQQQAGCCEDEAAGGGARGSGQPQPLEAKAAGPGGTPCSARRAGPPRPRGPLPFPAPPAASAAAVGNLPLAQPGPGGEGDPVFHGQESSPGTLCCLPGAATINAVAQDSSPSTACLESGAVRNLNSNRLI